MSNRVDTARINSSPTGRGLQRSPISEPYTEGFGIGLTAEQQLREKLRKQAEQRAFLDQQMQEREQILGQAPDPAPGPVTPSTQPPISRAQPENREDVPQRPVYAQLSATSPNTYGAPVQPQTTLTPQYLYPYPMPMYALSPQMWQSPPGALAQPPSLYPVAGPMVTAPPLYSAPDSLSQPQQPRVMTPIERQVSHEVPTGASPPQIPERRQARGKRRLIEDDDTAVLKPEEREAYIERALKGQLSTMEEAMYGIADEVKRRRREIERQAELEAEAKRAAQAQMQPPVQRSPARVSPKRPRTAPREESPSPKPDYSDLGPEAEGLSEYAVTLLRRMLENEASVSRAELSFAGGMEAYEKIKKRREKAAAQSRLTAAEALEAARKEAEDQRKQRFAQRQAPPAPETPAVQAPAAMAQQATPTDPGALQGENAQIRAELDQLRQRTEQAMREVSELRQAATQPQLPPEKPPEEPPVEDPTIQLMRRSQDMLRRYQSNSVSPPVARVEPPERPRSQPPTPRTVVTPVRTAIVGVQTAPGDQSRPLTAYSASIIRPLVVQQMSAYSRPATRAGEGSTEDDLSAISIADASRMRALAELERLGLQDNFDAARIYLGRVAYPREPHKRTALYSELFHWRAA